MTNIKKLVTKFYRTRSSYYRWNRLLFPSAAEVRFVHIMGGRYFQIWWLKHPKTKRPFTIVYSLGRVLRDERFKREVRVGRFFVDLGNDCQMAVEIDGARWHRDIIKEMKRDEYLAGYGWRVLHLPAVKLWNDPAYVQRTILKFVYK